MQIMQVTKVMQIIRDDGKLFPDCKKRLEILKFYKSRTYFCPPGCIKHITKNIWEMQKMHVQESFFFWLRIGRLKLHVLYQMHQHPWSTVQASYRQRRNISERSNVVCLRVRGLWDVEYSVKIWVNCLPALFSTVRRREGNCQCSSF